MSKEIAQTVGGKKIAWLIAIVAAFAVFATISLNTKHADAQDAYVGFDHYSAMDAQTLNHPDTTLVDGQDSVGAVNASTDSLIPIGVIGRLVEATILSIHADSTDTPSEVSVAIRGSGFIRQATLLEVLVARTGLSPYHGDSGTTTHYLSAISSLDPPVGCTLWQSCATSNSKNIPTGPSSVNKGLVSTEGVLSSAMPSGQLSGTTNKNPLNDQSESSASDNSNNAVWLYAVLALGALAFGVGGATVARRSR